MSCDLAGLARRRYNEGAPETHASSRFRETKTKLPIPSPHDPAIFTQYLPQPFVAMPRPKAPKLVKTAPNLDYLKTASTKTIYRETSPASSAGRVTNATDDSDGLVVSRERGRGKSEAMATEAEYSMSGALAVEETTGSATRLKPPPKRIAEEVTRIAREADHVVATQEKRNLRTLEERKQSQDEIIPSSVPLQNFLGAQHVGSQQQRQSAALLGSRRPSFASRGHQTPLGQSSSKPGSMMLFKKRARQPSLLQMLNVAATQGEDGSEEDDESGEDLEDLDDFRPDDESTPLIKSLLQSNNVHETSSSSHSSQQQNSGGSGSRKRKLKSPEIQVPVSQFSNPAEEEQPLAAEKQGSSHVHLDPENDVSDPEIESTNEEPVLPRREAPPTSPEEEQIFSDTMAPPESSSSPSPDDRHQYINKGLAPSSTKDDAYSVARPRNGSRHTPMQPGRAKPAATTPTSVNRKTRNNASKKPKPLTTATLQNLLPRRRRNQTRPFKSTYDIPSTSEFESSPGPDDTENVNDNSDDDDDEEDELSFSASRQPTRKRRPQPPSMAIKANKTTPLQRPSPVTRPSTNKRKAKPSTTTALTTRSPSTTTTVSTISKSKPKPKSKPQTNSKNNQNDSRRVSRTYSRKSTAAADDDDPDQDASGVENDAQQQGGTGAPITLNDKAQAEMARLARKFREVDDYALDFEDVTASHSGSGSSQMKDAR